MTRQTRQPMATPRPPSSHHAMPSLLHGCFFPAIALAFALKEVYFNMAIGLPYGPHFGQGITLITMTMLAILLLSRALPSRRGWIAIHASFSFIVLADLWYFRFFGELPSAMLLSQAAGPKEVLVSLPYLIRPSDGLLFIDLPLFSWWYRRLTLAPNMTSAGFLWSCAVLALLVAILHPPQLSPWRYLVAETYQPIFMLELGIAHYHARDLLQLAKHAMFQPKAPTAEQWALIKSFEGKPVPPSVPAKKPPANLIMIQFESLQLDLVNRLIGRQEITPNLNRLIKDSYSFPNFYHQTGEGHTSDAELLTQTSSYGMKEGIAFWSWQRNHFCALPDILRQAGYDTMSIHGNHASYYNRQRMHHNWGFNHSYFQENFNRDELLGIGLSDKSVLQQSVSLLERRKRPFYSFIVTLSSHFPFDGPFPTRHPLELGTMKNTLLGNYCEAVHYTDEAIGDFLNALQHKGLYSSSILVIYGDHNGLPLENRTQLSALGVPADPHPWLQNQRVPLIIHMPEGEEKTILRLGGQIDLAPTIASLLGVPSPPGWLLGHDLLREGEHQVVFRNGNWIDSRYLSEESHPQGNRLVLDRRTDLPTDDEPTRAAMQQASHVLLVSDTLASFDLSQRLAQREASETPRRKLTAK